MPPVKVPADVELEDRLAFGLTGKQLSLLAATAVSAYGAFLLLTPLLPAPVALAAAVIVLVGGVFLTLVRHDGLSGDQLALAFARFALAPKRQVLAPETLPTPPPRTPRQPRIAPLDIPIRRVLTSGLVELTDSSYCLLLSAQATSFELRSADEQAAFVSAFARFLNALAEPIQISVQSAQTSLQPQADQIVQAAESQQPGLRAAALDHAHFLRSLGETKPLRRRRIVLVLRTRERQPALARAALERLAAEATELLRGAEVHLDPLDGDQAAALLARSLDPPGPAEGSHLQGVIHATAHAHIPEPDQNRQRRPARPRRAGTARRPRSRRAALAADARDPRLPA
jgi:hypothetical protein